MSFSVGNTTGVFNFPYPSRCHPFPYFPFPSLLTGNTTTAFDFSLPFPCNPFPYSPLHVTPLSSFLYPSRYHTSPTFPFPSILTGSTTIVFEFPSPAIPYPTLTYTGKGSFTDYVIFFLAFFTPSLLRNQPLSRSNPPPPCDNNITLSRPDGACGIATPIFGKFLAQFCQITLTCSKPCFGCYTCSY